MSESGGEVSGGEVSGVVGDGVGGTRLAWPDLVVIAGYFIMVLAVGIWSSRRSNKGSFSGYFLASRNLHWLPVGASLFGSNIGSGHFIGLAGAGAASGIAAHGYEQAAIYGLLLLGWLFMPVYMSAGVYTMPEYIGLRYGGRRIRLYLSCISLTMYIFTKIAADLYAGALFIQLSLNKSSTKWLYLSVILLLVVAGVFTIIGGLTTVVYTDLVQMFLMVGGALVLSGMSFHAVGGYNALVEKYRNATATIRAVDKVGSLCGEPPDDYMNLLRSGRNGYPWYGMTFGMSVLQVWYWCTDQVIVQRTLASRSIVHGKGGTVLAAYLKYLPLFIMVFPGMAARVLYPDRVGCADPEQCKALCGSEKGCSNTAYIELVLNLMPSGLRGLLLAVMMAALMSSLTSVFNSASTIFTIDIWRRLRRSLMGLWGWVNGQGMEDTMERQLSETEMIVVSRVVVLILVVISVVWIPVIQNFGSAELFDYMNAIISCLCPPICAIFVMGLFVPRVNETGAFWSLMVGEVLGVLRFVGEFAYTVPPCGSLEPDPRPYIIKKVIGDFHYMTFCLLSFVISVAVAVCVSLVTPPIPEDRLYRLTFWSRRDRRVRRPLESEAIDPENTTSPQPHPKCDMEIGDPTDQVPASSADAGWRMKVMGQVCGDGEGGENHPLSSSTPLMMSKEEEARKAVEFLEEEPFWRNVANINAVLCLTLSTFVYCFYA